MYGAIAIGKVIELPKPEKEHNHPENLGNEHLKIQLNI